MLALGGWCAETCSKTGISKTGPEIETVVRVMMDLKHASLTRRPQLHEHEKGFRGHFLWTARERRIGIAGCRVAEKSDDTGV